MFGQACGVKDLDAADLPDTVWSQTRSLEELLQHKSQVKLEAGPEERRTQSAEAQTNLFVLLTERCRLTGLPTGRVVFHHTALAAAYPNKALREGGQTFTGLELLKEQPQRGRWLALKSGSVK